MRPAFDPHVCSNIAAVRDSKSLLVNKRHHLNIYPEYDQIVQQFLSKNLFQLIKNPKKKSEGKKKIGPKIQVKIKSIIYLFICSFIFFGGGGFRFFFNSHHFVSLHPKTIKTHFAQTDYLYFPIANFYRDNVTTA